MRLVAVVSTLALCAMTWAAIIGWSAAGYWHMQADKYAYALSD
jgi:hypothetical protein